MKTGAERCLPAELRVRPWFQQCGTILVAHALGRPAGDTSGRSPWLIAALPSTSGCGRWPSQEPSTTAQAVDEESGGEAREAGGGVARDAQRSCPCRSWPVLLPEPWTPSRSGGTGGVVTAWVLFDGSNGIHVNRRTRIRDQERSPIAADLKRLMRAKSRRGRRTLAHTADVAEAHRQVPIHPQDWHMLGRSSLRPCCGDLRSGVRVLFLVVGRRGDRACHAVLCRKQSGHVACTCCGRFPPRGRRSRVSPHTPRLLRGLCHRRGSSFLAKDRRW